MRWGVRGGEKSSMTVFNASRRPGQDRGRAGETVPNGFEASFESSFKAGGGKRRASSKTALNRENWFW